MADPLQFVTYCGLYCGLCSARTRVPQQAAALLQTMSVEGYEHWATDMPDFLAFWRFLKCTSDLDQACPGCRQGGGPPFCSIRKCAQRRNVDVCSHCEEYPCERIQALAKGYPTLVADGRRMCEIGLDAWIREQDERAETGFAYCDIRCYPYSVPED